MEKLYITLDEIKERGWWVPYIPVLVTGPNSNECKYLNDEKIDMKKGHWIYL